MADIGVEWWILYGSIGILAAMVGIATLGALNSITRELKRLSITHRKATLELQKLNKKADLSLNAMAQTAKSVEAMSEIKKEFRLLCKQLDKTNKHAGQLSNAVTAHAILFKQTDAEIKEELKKIDLG
jgi:hypothetical protein